MQRIRTYVNPDSRNAGSAAASICALHYARLFGSGSVAASGSPRLARFGSTGFASRQNRQRGRGVRFSRSLGLLVLLPAACQAPDHRPAPARAQALAPASQT